MLKINDTIKAYIIGFLVIVLVIGIIFFTAKVIDNIKESRLSNNNDNKYNDIYGTVIKKEGDIVIIKPIDEELGSEIRIESDVELTPGDFVLIDDEIKLIASNEELKDNIIEDDVTTTTTSTTTTYSNEILTTSIPTLTTIISDEEVVLNYVSNIDNNISFKDKAKSYFITLVDFIFYGGEIKGITWEEISNSAKAKVIYYVLLVDDKIENKWPNYKEEIGSKVDDIKAKLIAKYMDITTNICEKNLDTCEQVKEDFASLKASLNITWEAVKGAFKYRYDKTTTYLKNWYEVFSGKL